MASGEKLPNTNLNLIQDTDMIDYEDINAIAQAVEANTTKIKALYPLQHVPNGTDLHTLGTGAYLLGSTGQYVNGVGGGMYGVLNVTVVSSIKLLNYHNHLNRVWVKTFNGTSWADWREI